MTHQPLVVAPGAGLTVPLGASSLTIKLDSAATGGRLALLEYNVAPAFAAPQRMHWRTRETQAIYILSGRIRYQLDDQVVDAQAGTVLHLPEHCAFTWSNPDPAPARMLYVFVPAGLEQFFLDVQQVFRDHPGLDPAAAASLVEELWRSYGVLT
ncbi:cupin domain-containing protein [Synechococcus sp. CS-1329]|uniref:cupin domain-containing protein n=1 Tax=Synechococcus sp. CS-1329 TaxID=2847975 RepID=UPI00223B19D4|nr:cupin domain-containing protein [Synechococcus sp. CS-1329]MCT0217456.1 cupin domain-containing protein [Synechococcus sp. CS-1329]